ncbi:GAP1-N1 domain-containing protein [Flavobacterium notoginsengisoli]|uniref:GAP1-N1 domain-containing protein n=1 Tax=Flavobacterium notoginsengisoli TaxID=1478199 RepID=UPI00362A17B7
MDNLNSIKIHQTLHGYSNGHSLLASSIELDSEIKRVMLPISDMSGSTMISGFESYITGYPLKDGNFYALSKTWYAPEMKRPGCVYTHTLLIDFTDLPKIKDIYQLLSLFKRPGSEKVKFSDYEKSLKYNTNNHNTNNQSLVFLKEKYEKTIKEILFHLYSFSNTLFLKNKQSLEDFERIFLLIWMQQWPRLKRNFSFCTGAIAPRIFANTLLDLQLVSPKLDSIFTSDNNVLILEQNSGININMPEWVNLAFESLFNPSNTLIRYFNFFGSDFTARRSSFKVLSETYLFFYKNNPALPECIDYIAKNFPAQKDGRSLKNSIFGYQKTQINEILPNYDEAAILYHFAITEDFMTFDYEKLDYCNRFCNYFLELSENSLLLLKEILAKDINQQAMNSMSSLALKLESSNDLKSIWNDEYLSYVFINLNTDFAYRKEFWQHNVKNHLELIVNLQYLNEKNIDWQTIIGILIEINSPVDPVMFKDYHLEIQNLVLDRINNNLNVKIGENWLKTLTAGPSLQWFSKQENFSTPVIERLIYVFNPNSKQVINVGLTPWLNYIQKLNNPNEMLSLDAKSFLLALAFNCKEEKGKKIFESTVETVYFALANEILNFYLWQNIQLHTKSLGLFKDWDKCKKLLNAVADQYIKNRWDIADLLDNFKNKELVNRMFTQYRKRK